MVNGTIARRPGAVWVALHDDAIVAHPDLDARYRLDGVAASLWRHLDAPCEIDDLVDVVLARYAAARPEVEDDVARFVSSMRESGLLVVERPDTPPQDLAARMPVSSTSTFTGATSCNGSSRRHCRAPFSPSSSGR